MPKKKVNKAALRESAEWIAINLKAMREAAGLSQLQLSKKLGCSSQHVAQIETGHHGVPTTRVITRFAAGCGFRSLMVFVPSKLTALPETEQPFAIVVRVG